MKVEFVARRLAFWVRRRLPKRVKKSLSRGSRVLGYDYAYPSLPGTLRMLSGWGFEPTFLVDAGAFEGEWTRSFREFFPNVTSLMVEPQASKQERLRSEAERAAAPTFVSAELLGPENGTVVDFYEMQTGSSVLSELTSHPRTAVPKTTTRLDTLLERFAHLGQPDFLKLDVQGYELAVLDGGPMALHHCGFVYLEASLAPYNEGAPLIADVIAYMNERGFSVIDLCSQMRRGDGMLRQTDLLFMNRASAFVDAWSRVDG